MDAARLLNIGARLDQHGDKIGIVLHSQRQRRIFKVGNIWIGLSKRSFGIHGTPNPSLISKTASHGCIRLTNWDANDLGGKVRSGVTVKFLE